MNQSPDLAARRRSLFWRIHFWAALIASPFALLAALTGILYIFTPQLEHALYGDLDRVATRGQRLPLDAAVAAARAALPAGWTLKSVAPAHAAHDTVKLFFKAPQHAAMAAHEHAEHATAPQAGKVVYVNPYTAAVVGSHDDGARFGAWSKKLHSSLLLGDGWRWMIELAASWLMVMLLSGAYLWWPRGAGRALPQAGARGRVAWKQWHGFIGVALSVMSLTILSTGLTWSKYAGDQVRLVRDLSGQAPPAPAPGLKSVVPGNGAAMNWQQAWQTAQALSPDIALQLAAPQGADGVWRVNNYDRTQPTKRVDLVLDAYTGRALFASGWRDQTAFSKATGVGIPFHRGEFGWWNQALLLLFGIGVLASMGSGWVMFFKRRKTGSPALPRLLPGAWRSAPAAAWAVAGGLFFMLPLLALSSALVIAVELALAARPFARRGEPAA